MKKIKIIFGVMVIAAIVLLSELLYAGRNKWVYYSYLLNTAKFFNNVGATNTAFFIATERKYKLPDNQQFKKDVNLTFKNLPTKYDLPTTIYYFAISAYNNDLDYLTPLLLNISIKMDPDLSFWRVELANYYLVANDTEKAEQILDDCLTLPYPARHCQNYIDEFLVPNKPENVGFLSSSIPQYFNDQFSK